MVILPEKKESYTGVSTTFSGNDLRKVSTGNILNTLSMLDPSFTKVVNNEMGSDPNTILISRFAVPVV